MIFSSGAMLSTDTGKNDTDIVKYDNLHGCCVPNDFANKDTCVIKDSVAVTSLDDVCYKSHGGSGNDLKLRKNRCNDLYINTQLISTGNFVCIVQDLNIEDYKFASQTKYKNILARKSSLNMLNGLLQPTTYYTQKAQLGCTTPMMHSIKECDEPYNLNFLTKNHTDEVKHSTPIKECDEATSGHSFSSENEIEEVAKKLLFHEKEDFTKKKDIISSSPAGIFVCDFQNCSYISSHQNCYKRHTQAHCTKREFHCSMCGLGYNQQWRLKRHLMEHRKESSPPKSQNKIEDNQTVSKSKCLKIEEKSEDMTTSEKKDYVNLNRDKISTYLDWFEEMLSDDEV